jgi:hypothetical protein
VLFVDEDWAGKWEGLETLEWVIGEEGSLFLADSEYA